jgi:hypothetical protein
LVCNLHLAEQRDHARGKILAAQFFEQLPHRLARLAAALVEQVAELLRGLVFGCNALVVLTQHIGIAGFARGTPKFLQLLGNPNAILADRGRGQ